MAQSLVHWTCYRFGAFEEWVQIPSYCFLEQETTLIAQYWFVPGKDTTVIFINIIASVTIKLI